MNFNLHAQKNLTNGCYGAILKKFCSFAYAFYHARPGIYEQNNKEHIL